MEGGRLQIANTNVCRAPTARPVRYQVATNPVMEFQQQRFVQKTVVELSFGNGETHFRHSLSQEWGQLRITQDPERRFNEAGIPIWRRIFWSVSEEIASPSKAIVLAILSGIAMRRRRRFSCGASLRHSSIFFCHVIPVKLPQKGRLSNCKSSKLSKLNAACNQAAFPISAYSRLL